MSFRGGSILIVTLWVLSILTFFAFSLGFSVRTQLRYADHIQDRLRMHYLAQAGIERAVEELMNDETEAYDTMNEPWSNNEDLFKEMSFDNGFITLSHVLKESREADEITLYGVMDESSRIDINTASVDTLTTLLERIGEIPEQQATEIAAAIQDWRDRDIIVSPNGAEDEYYLSLDLPYECKDEEFRILEELLLVKGMTAEIFSKIKDILTVYGTGRVNINTAGFNTLYALGLNESLCERITEFRQGNDGIIGTEDDNIFNSVEDLRDTGPMFTEESIQINNLIAGNMLIVKSDIFRINSAGQLKDSKSMRSRNIVCVLRRQKDKQPKVLFWYED